MLAKALELPFSGWRPNKLKQTPVILPHLTDETMSAGAEFILLFLLV